MRAPARLMTETFMVRYWIKVLKCGKHRLSGLQTSCSLEFSRQWARKHKPALWLLQTQ